MHSAEGRRLLSDEGRSEAYPRSSIQYNKSTTQGIGTAFRIALIAGEPLE